MLLFYCWICFYEIPEGEHSASSSTDCYGDGLLPHAYKLRPVRSSLDILLSQMHASEMFRGFDTLPCQQAWRVVWRLFCAWVET